MNSGSLNRSQDGFPVDSPCTFLVIGKQVSADYKNWTAVPTKTITTIADVNEVVADPAVKAVLYDPEGWSMTPREEQADPASAACRAQTAVHNSGKAFIVTPAINLVRFIAPGSGSNSGRFAAFEKTQTAARMAKCADIYEIQAQGAEKDPGTFRKFVEAEAQQARAANPNVIVLAGISTNPMGQQVSATDVFKAVDSVRRTVDGFWLNIPAGGKFCPSCGEPKPTVAVELLDMLTSK